MNGTPLHQIEALRAVRFWPGEDKLDVDRWLSNFDDDDKDTAKVLLTSFVFLSESVVESLLVDAYASLRRNIKMADWNLVDGEGMKMKEPTVLLTFPTGEIPNVTDSGYLFARKMRQLFDLEESGMVEPSQAVEVLASSKPNDVRNTALVLVDDFAGSGEQVCKTLERRIRVADGKLVSIQDLAKQTGLRVYYCLLVATRDAKMRLEREHSYISVNCPHVLGKRYNIKSKNCAIISASAANAVHSLIRKYAGIYLKSPNVKSWVREYGFHDLGLTIAFEHSVPDATLPIFWADGSNWKPLYRRS